MRRRLTTLRSKSAGYATQNGNPRALADEVTYREIQNHRNWVASSGKDFAPLWDPRFSGWSNGARPRDYPIFLRPITPSSD